MLSDGKVSLRALEPTDLDMLFKWENDSSLWSVGSTIAPFSRKQLWDYIENYDNDIFSARQLRFMIEDKNTGEPVGMIDLYDFDPVNARVSVGVLVDSRYGHQGYATMALNSIIYYASSVIGVHQLVAYIPEDNTHSRGLFSKCGFVETAILQSWLRLGTNYKNVIVSQLILNR